ncbi:OLC1v1017224C1 [Oldenlandia corymbosa var. corymbosa]|uniref:OLC1v1017224C1 n=1 Tax=Oldenlandia corymbosa var. corymbosa TaxID=529605 RepID=A0AAV1E8Y3_OLDCO|nr:OLC1v1017224C1 [Oldenlandia corymbosa var. corymbosa]
MENHEHKDASQCVRVAVNVRPLVTPELLVGCTDCVTVVPGEPQVQIGSHAFTFDYVFGSAGLPSSRIFDECVAPLVEALFHGYNGTVLAYGQTGSGKTYTMGTNYNGEEHQGGVIPKVMETIFSRVEAMRESTEFLIRVSFIEIFKEEVFDLLDQNSQAFPKADGTSSAKPTGPARVPIHIRETVNGGITLAGVTEAEVRTKEEMSSFLLRGSVARATGSTNMNSQSSRSHAIFTISMEQKRMSSCSTGQADDFGDEILSAKLHLVDLAGSERAKRTGADGLRLREGIHINKGLLALGNVISALGDDKRRKEGGHVPYRDSKLTRLLQDSLGGNSKTVMIACISPADTNAEETLNTLKYANRARNIQNKAIINRDPMAAQVQRMKNQIEMLQAELLFFRGESTVPFEELQILKHKVSLLEANNIQLQQELQEQRISCEHFSQQALDAQVERDRLLMKIESFRSGKALNEIDFESNQDLDMVKGYVSKIQKLEGEVIRLQSLTHSRRNELVDYVDMDDSGLHSKDGFLAEAETKASNLNREFEDEEKERDHSSLQEKLDRELKELDKRLEQKEAEMKQFANADTSVLKQHYDKKVHELELEKRALQKEIEELRHNLSTISSTTDDSAQKLKADYLQKLNILEAQVAELKKKQDAQAQLLRQKQKSDDAAKRLQDEIQRIKSQKVHLQQKIKQESEQFRLWKASREKEVLQLKKEGRRNEYEMHKLLALNQRQKMVLQRKTEEAAQASKRLKELLESRKASRELSGSSSAAGIQALMQAIEHELEVMVRVHEVRTEYERQMEERARMAKEVAELKEEAAAMKQGSTSNFRRTMSPGARNSRIFALENMLATSSSALVSMASHLSEAEERERAFSGRGRWNQVRSLPEAKNIMNFLFNLASSSRCQLKDREVDCREKDSEIRDLKEKVVKLVRQIELQKADLIRQEKLMILASQKPPNGDFNKYETRLENGAESRLYDLRPTGARQSIIFNGGNNLQLEDMDISDSDYSDMDKTDDDDYELEQSDMDGDDSVGFSKVRKRTKKRNSKNSNHSGTSSCPISINSDGMTEPTSHGGDSSVNQLRASAFCCSCSKSSMCKTNKCECRASDGHCGSSCGCDPSKCSNRESGPNQNDHDPPRSGFSGSTASASEIDEAERNHILASHGATLLNSALSGKSAVNDDNGSRRKPLSDIGNTTAKSNAPKPSQRKKWGKSTIQLVPAPPPPSTEPENLEASIKQESISNESTDIPLKLPRAMRSAFMNNNPLRERNSDQQSDVTVTKDTGTTAPGSPPRQVKRVDEKENRG